MTRLDGAGGRMTLGRSQLLRYVASGISHAEVARLVRRRTPCSRELITKLCAGRGIPSVPVAVELARLCGIAVEAWVESTEAAAANGTLVPRAEPMIDASPDAASDAA